MAQSDPTRLTTVAQAALVDDPEFLRELVQHALQTILEAEMEAHLGASRYERTPERRGYRNGYKPRQLQTRVGTLNLLVPIEDCFACLAFPTSHQRRIRTTNGLERVNQELKRRTRVVRIFPNRAACLRLVTALAAEISEDWESGRRYLNMEEVIQEQPAAAESERSAAD